MNKVQKSKIKLWYPTKRLPSTWLSTCQLSVCDAFFFLCDISFPVVFVRLIPCRDDQIARPWWWIVENLINVQRTNGITSAILSPFSIYWNQFYMTATYVDLTLGKNLSRHLLSFMVFNLFSLRMLRKWKNIEKRHPESAIPRNNHPASNCQPSPHRILNYLWDMRQPNSNTTKLEHIIFYMRARYHFQVKANCLISTPDYISL